MRLFLLAINGALLSFVMLLSGLIISDLFGMNLPYSVGATIRLQGEIIRSWATSSQQP